METERKTHFWRHLLSWVGITAVLSTMLLAAPHSQDTTEAQGAQFSIAEQVGATGLSVNSDSPIQTVFAITMSDSENGQTLTQMDLTFAASIGSPTWTQNTTSSSILEDLGSSNLSGVVLYKDQQGGINNAIDANADTFIPLDNPQYGANGALTLTPKMTETISTGTTYLVGIQTDNTGLTNDDAFTVSVDQDGVITSGTNPSVPAVTPSGIITLEIVDEWNYDTAHLVSAKALDGNYNENSRLEMIFDRSISPEITTGDVDYYVWAHTSDWQYRDAGTGATLTQGTTQVLNDTVTLTFGSNPNFAEGDTLEVSVPIPNSWSWGSGETELDLTGPTLQVVTFEDSNSDGQFNVAGDCGTFIFSEEIDPDTINTASFHSSIPNSNTSQFPVVYLDWISPNMVDVCLTDIVSDTVGATFDPAVTVRDFAGNADNTTTPPAMGASTAPAPISSITLQDSDTSGYGVDANDILVSWTTYNDGTLNHCDVYILPLGEPLQIGTHFPMNDTGFDCATNQSFSPATDVSAYLLWEDSRANYAADYSTRTEWYDLDSNTQYIAYVVTSGAAHASETLADVSIAQSNAAQFTAEYGNDTNDWDQAPWLTGYSPEWGAYASTNMRNLSMSWSESMGADSVVSTDNFTVRYDSNSDNIVDGTDTEIAINSITYDNIAWATEINLAEDLPTTADVMVRVDISQSVVDSMGTPMGYDDYFYFYTSGTSDSTSPTVTYGSVNDGATGISTFETIEVSFSEAMQVPTFVNSNVAFNPVVSGYTLFYDTWSDKLEIRFTNPMSANTSYALTLGTELRDLAGNPFAGSTINFTTGNADNTSIQASYASADEWGLFAGFNGTVNSSTLTSDNITLTNDSTGIPVNLSNASIWYNPDWYELEIQGLDFTEGDSYTITFNSNVKGANGNAIDPNNDSLQFTVMGMTDFGFENITLEEGDTYEFGQHDTVYDADFMMFSPAWVWPRNSMADQTAVYDFGFPVNGALDNGSTVIVQFPSGFDVTSPTMNTTDFWGVDDLNGGGNGIVTATSVVGDNADKTVTITLNVVDGNGDPTSTSSNDYFDFSIGGIVNPSDASVMDWFTNTGGHTLNFSVRNSASQWVLEALESERFEINELGLGTIEGTAADMNGDPVAGAVVYAESWMIGMISDTTDANGEFSITGLPTSDTTYWLWVEAPAGYMGDHSWNEVSLTDAAKTSTGNSLYLTASDCVISGTISHTGTTGDVRVFANSPSAWVDEQVTLSGSSTDYTLNLSEGSWDVGVEPWFWNPGQQSFSPPPPSQVTCSAATSPVDNDVSIAQAEFTITGTVTDQNGNGLGSVHVDAFNPYSSWGGGVFTDTAADGSYTMYVAEGNYSVNVWKEGLGWVPEQNVFLDSSNTSATANFVISKPSASVSGTVTDEAGNPLSYASVEAFPATGGFYDHAWTQTDSDGNYVLYLNAGTWNFEVWAWQYGKVPAKTGVTTTNVTVADSATVTSIDFQYDTAAFNEVSGQVLDSSSNGVANAMVWCDEVNSSTGMYTGNFNSSMTDTDGNYTMRLPKNTSGTTTYTCMGDSWEMGRTDPITGIDISSASATGQDMTFGTQYTVTVTITGAPSDLTWASVDIWNPETWIGNWGDFNNFSDGTATTTVLMSDGTYEVHTWIDGFGDFDADLTVAGADTSVTIDIAEYLANAVTISGTVTADGSAVPYAWVDAFNMNNGKVRGASTDSSGAYSLVVSEGTWEVRADAPNYVGGAPVSVSETSTVNIALTAADATISGTVYKSDGTTAASGGWMWANEPVTGASVTSPVNGDGTFSLPVSSGGGTWTLNAGDMGYEGSTTASVGATDADITLDTVIGWWDADVEPTTGAVDPDEGYNFSDEDNTGVNISFGPGDLGSGDTANITIQPAAAPATSTKDIFNAIDISAVQGDQTISNLSSSVDLDIVLDQDDINSLIDNGEIAVTRFRNDLENTVVNSWSTENSTYVAADATTIQVEADGTAMDATEFWTAMETAEESGVHLCGTDAGATYETCEITYDSGTQHLTIFGLITSSDTTAPSAPSGLAATAGDSSVALAWTANSESDLLEYEVYRDTTANVSLTAANQLNSTQLTTNAYTDTSVINGTTYYYAVTAVDTSGNESAAPTAVSGAPSADDSGDDTTTTIISGGGGGSNIAADQTYFADDEEETTEEAVEETAEEVVAEVTTMEESTTEEVVEETVEVVAETVEAAVADYIDHWAEEFIMVLLDEGIAQGVSESEFAPDRGITRAELTKMVVNAAGYAVPAVPENKPFSDVEVDDWFAPYVEVAKNQGLIEGYYDGTFRPNVEVNRAEALKMLLESTLGKNIVLDSSQGVLANFGLSENPFTDLVTSAWYAKYVLYAFTHDIVGGYADGTFGANESITRAEFSKILVLTMEM